jgi:hypothetical protein
VRLLARSKPPADAIQFGRDVWMQVPPQRVLAYFVMQPAWEHLDGSPCPAGLDVPLGEWAAVDIPLRCADGRQVRAKPGSSPFWVDGISGRPAG